MVDTDGPARFHVVLNHEEQYSIWPADREPPDGWRREGTSGTEQQCLDHIDTVWTDMRPLSLRRFMAEQERHASAGTPPERLEQNGADVEPLMERLARSPSRIEVVLRPAPSIPALRAAVDDGYVLVRFTETLGGTELGIPIDADLSDLTGADFDAGTGSLHIAGVLTVDFTAIRCEADVDLPSMTGLARVEVLP